MTRPVVTGLVKTVFQNQSIAASELFTLTPGSSPVTSYFFEDFNTLATSGYFSLNGVAMTQGQRFEISVADLANLQYVGGSSIASERIRIYARDAAGQFSDQSVVSSAFTVRANTTAPWARVNPITVVGDESIAASSFISGWDPDGHPIQSYRIRDASSNSGYFELNGIRQNQGVAFVVNSSDFSKLRYFASNAASSENIEVTVFDGVQHSPQANGLATIIGNFSQPIVRYVSRTILGTSTLNLPITTLVTDADQNTMKRFQFYNDSVNPNHGEILFNGVVQPRRTWITVNSADFNKLTFKPKNVQSLPVQTIKYSAYDGSFWSQGINQIDIQTTYVIPPIKPIFTSTATEFYDAQRQAKLVSSLFAKRDAGVNYTGYEVYDPTTDSASGYFTVSNVVQTGGNVLSLTPTQFANTRWVTGAYENHLRETIYVRANNGQFWSNWEKVDVTDYPEIWRATNGGASWFNQPMLSLLPVNGLGQRQLSFSFMQEFPDYETGEAEDGDPLEGRQFERFTDVQRENVRVAFDHMEELLNVEFVEIADTDTNVFGQRGGIFRFGEYGIPAPESSAAAFAFFPGTAPQSGDSWYNRLNMSPSDLDFVRGTPGFAILIHELGHAMGLKHPFQGVGRLPESIDNELYSVMSYTPSPTSPASSYMLYDIHQLQRQYGANVSYRAGDDTYSPSSPGFFAESTIWDAGGIDTISWFGATTPSTIDLRQGMRSEFGTSNGLRIAIGVDLERAIGGNNKDTIYGNALANALSGHADNDLIVGGKGDDYLRGGAGNETYVFGIGDGFDVIDEQGLGGTDTLLISQVNEKLGSPITPVAFAGMDFLQDDMVFRRIANDLVVDLRLNRGDSEGITRITNHFSNPLSQIETLNFLGTRVDLVDLGTKIVGTNVNHRFQISSTMGANGFLATLV
jgi:serralysin